VAGEQITERGIGNGISLIIFAGIVARLPEAILGVIQTMGAPGQLGPFGIPDPAGFMIAVVGFIVLVERGQRRIPVQYGQADCGPAGCTEVRPPSSLKIKRLRHSAHFCLFHHHVPGDDCELLEREEFPCFRPWSCPFPRARCL